MNRYPADLEESFDLEVLKFEEETAINVAENIISIYNSKVDELVKNYDIIPEYITNLKLQKLLYFVQALCLMVFDKPAFSEKILAWEYGPVVKEVYRKYKTNRKKEIKTETNIKNISSGLYEIINEVVTCYGSIEANKLKIQLIF